MRRMNDEAFDALLTHGATAPMRHMRMGVIGGVRARTDVLALPADNPIWWQITSAFMRTAPAHDRPQPIGRLAARGLLDVLLAGEAR